jgi:branched chain amino acid efflux pump
MMSLVSDLSVGQRGKGPSPDRTESGRLRRPGGSASKRAEFLAGARDQLPLLLGVVPFGLIFGALALSAGIPALEAQAFSLFIFAGSAQFIAIGLVAGQTPALLIIATILVVNLRHMLYGATLGPHVQHLPLRWKVPLAWLLTDEAFATTSLRYLRDEKHQAHWYFLGAGLTLWASWQASTVAGIALGARIPESWSLDFALPLTFLAILVPQVRDWPSLTAALVAGIIAILLAGVPLRLGLMISILIGVAAGAALETLLRERAPAQDGGQ